VVLLAAFGEDQGDVVVLFLGAEAEDFVDHGGERSARCEGAVAAQKFSVLLMAGASRQRGPRS